MPKPPIRAICAWIFVMFIVAGAAIFCYIFSSYSGSDEVVARQNQCTDSLKNVSDNKTITLDGSIKCALSPFVYQDPPERLPNPQINITVKTIHFLWLGDCKVMTSTGEVYHSAEDQICMAQPGENLAVYQYRTRDNTITDLIQMEA